MGRRPYRSYHEEEHSLRKVTPNRKVGIKRNKIISDNKDDPILFRKSQQIKHNENNFRYCPYCEVKLDNNFVKHAEEGCAFFNNDREMITHHSLSEDDDDGEAQAPATSITQQSQQTQPTVTTQSTQGSNYFSNFSNTMGGGFNFINPWNSSGFSPFGGSSTQDAQTQTQTQQSTQSGSFDISSILGGSGQFGGDFFSYIQNNLGSGFSSGSQSEEPQMTLIDSEPIADFRTAVEDYSPKIPKMDFSFGDNFSSFSPTSGSSLTGGISIL